MRKRVKSLNLEFPLTTIEKKFFEWAEEQMKDFWDEAPMQDCISGMCKHHRLDEDIADWLIKVFWVREGLDAGIPLSVVLGETKLSDHFSQEYIDFKKGVKE